MTMRWRRRVVDLRSGERGWVKPRGYRLLSWLRWEYEYELEDGWTRATWEIPSWAASPTADIIGTWRATRRRLVMGVGLPLWKWSAV